MPTASDVQNLISNGLSLAKIGQTIMGAIDLLLTLLPWAAVILLALIAWNPKGVGDKIVAAMREFLVTVGMRVQESAKAVAEVQAEVASVKKTVAEHAEKLDAILAGIEALKNKA
jgi:phage-related tail protein